MLSPQKTVQEMPKANKPDLDFVNNKVVKRSMKVHKFRIWDLEICLEIRNLKLEIAALSGRKISAVM